MLEQGITTCIHGNVIQCLNFVLSDHNDEEEYFIDLNAIKLDGSIKEVDPPKHLSKPIVESRKKQVSNIGSFIFRYIFI